MFENKKYYEIIVCQYNKINVHFEYEDVLLGPINKVKKTDIFKKFWEEKLKEFKRISSLKDSEDLLKKINTIENNIR